ncbi:MAG: GNAT family N-acetyltransferase [Anaerolineaceae bacterium]|nr:GNAT family N-acetyltransferase [Anaerolineaceae bacterium]
MNVEKAGFDDIDALVKLRLDYLCEDHGSLSEEDLMVIKRDLPPYFQAHLNKDLFVYVIREGEIIVSCAFLLIIEKPMSPSFINGKTGTVLNVYTCPSARRKGCAGAVMRTMISDAKEMKLSVIELKSTEDGYRLYRSVGFTDARSKYRMMKWKNL